MFPRFTLLSLVSLIALAEPLSAQLDPGGNTDAVRVTVAANQDGSHTTYQYDNANHKAVATTTSAAGKLLGKIRYELDEANRFSAGEIYGPDDKLRFKTKYKYDPLGRLIEETQLTKEGAVRDRIVYSYDQAGKQSGYVVYDADGNVLGQTTPKGAAVPTPPPKKKTR